MSRRQGRSPPAEVHCTLYLLVAMALRFLVVAALAVAASAFQAPATVVSRSATVAAAPARYAGVSMMSDEVMDKVRSAPKSLSRVAGAHPGLGAARAGAALRRASAAHVTRSARSRSIRSPPSLRRSGQGHHRGAAWR